MLQIPLQCTRARHEKKFGNHRPIFPCLFHIYLLSFTNLPGQKRTDPFTVPQILFDLKTSPSDSLLPPAPPLAYLKCLKSLSKWSTNKLLCYGRNIKYNTWPVLSHCSFFICISFLSRLQMISLKLVLKANNSSRQIMHSSSIYWPLAHLTVFLRSNLLRSCGSSQCCSV